MNDQRQSLLGCVIWVGIIMAIGAGFRAGNITQFLIMAGIIFVGLLAASWSLSTYSRGGFVNILVAFIYAYVGISLLATAGSFLWTGNYEEAIARIWRPRINPPASASVESESTPVVPATSLDPAEAEIPGRNFLPLLPDPLKEFWLSVAANTASSESVSEPFELWRLVTGIVLGLQFVAGFYVARYTRQRHVTRNFIFYGVLSALLMFTKVGEWVYALFTAVSGWGTWGYALLIFAIAMIGLLGLIVAMMGFNNTIGYILIGTICAYVITGFMYHNIQMLQFCVLPSMIMMLVVLYIAIYQARYRRYLKFG